MREHLEWPQFGTTDNERRLIRKYEERIATLEDALKDYMAVCPPITGQQRSVAKRAEALTSSEGAGERTAFAPYQGQGFPGWCQHCGKHRSLHRDQPGQKDGDPEFCPIHSPTSAAEGREDV